MPFMVGRAPVRRTLQYLDAGKLKFQKEVRVMTLNYNINQKASVGAYEFQFWHFPQIKYLNPEVQLLKFKNMTPTPFIQLMFIHGETMLIDVYGKSKIQIHDHLLSTFCDVRSKVDEEAAKKFNPGGFGYHCKHWCICEVPGQQPCPSWVRRGGRGADEGGEEETQEEVD